MHGRSCGTGRTRGNLLRLAGRVNLALWMLVALLVNGVLVVVARGAQVARVVRQIVGGLGTLVLLGLLLVLLVLGLLHLLHLLHWKLAWVIVQTVRVQQVLGKQLLLRHGLALRLAWLLGLVQTLGSASVHVGLL